MKIAHKTGTWTMIMVLFVHTLGINILYELYAVDKTFFIELFCVNQEKPELECEGACMLSKMDKQHKNDSDKPARIKIIQLQMAFFLQDVTVHFENIGSTKTIHESHYQNLYNAQYLKRIFRPPILV